MTNGAVNTPISHKCKICGGDIAFDYFYSMAICENCGNKWSIEEFIPDFKKYNSIIDKLTRAKGLLETGQSPADVSQALLLYKSASADCTGISDAVSLDIKRYCDKEMQEAEELKHYTGGKNYLEKDNYKKALSEFEKIKGFRDTDELIEACLDGIAVKRKKRIPYAIIIGMIIPAIVCIFLSVKYSFGLPLLIPVFLVLALALAYGIYLDGTVSIITEIISYLLSVPLIIYMVLAYGFHFEPGRALAFATLVPLGIIIVFAVLAERK